jgi:hypothetical protein
VSPDGFLCGAKDRDKKCRLPRLLARAVPRWQIFLSVSYFISNNETHFVCCYTHFLSIYIFAYLPT